MVDKTANYTDAAEEFVYNVYQYLVHYTHFYYNSTNLRSFTSDYALYWYDYLSDYDVILGEFVGNNSRQITVALDRGAANVLKKDWGIIITWKYGGPPFLEDAQQLYSDMVLAYQNGAKYLVVFNSPENHTPTNPLGTLTSEHLDAMRRFWNYAQMHSRQEQFTADNAYVLPTDYGYGFRGSNDMIWGMWNADSLSPKIWNDITSLVSQYGMNLDIVYENRIDKEPVMLPYSRLIYWNGTVTQTLGGK